nr:MAG TPA: hypothetical protein [Caudoviricetes sp.]
MFRTRIDSPYFIRLRWQSNFDCNYERGDE